MSGYRIITKDVGEPTVAHKLGKRTRDLFYEVHDLMRWTKYRNDHRDDWTPDMNRDCQGKTTAALLELHARGVPFEAMRGYAGGAALKTKGKYISHAVLVVRATESGTEMLAVFDNCQAGIRTMAWLNHEKIYKAMRPAMRVEAA